MEKYELLSSPTKICAGYLVDSTTKKTYFNQLNQCDNYPACCYHYKCFCNRKKFLKINQIKNAILSNFHHDGG